MLFKHKNGSNIINESWDFYQPFIREFEPKCADPVSDEKKRNNFFINSLKLCHVIC